MTHAFSTEGLQDLIRFPFQAERAGLKLTIAALMLLAGFIVPIIPSIFFMGYLYQIMWAVIHTGSLHLPEWDDWGKLFQDGLKYFGVTFVYSLPITALVIVVFGGYFLSIFLPLLSDHPSMSAFFGVSVLFMPFLLMIVSAVVYFLQILVMIVMPVSLANLVAKDRFAGGFEFGNMWRVFKANFTGYVLAYIISLGLIYLLTFVTGLLYMTLVLCCLLPLVLIVAAPYLAVVISALFAQVYREGLQKM